jgi:hypothetical protein
MIACKEGILSYHPSVKATPLLGQEKRGRPKSSQNSSQSKRGSSVGRSMPQENSIGRPPKAKRQNRFAMSEIVHRQ